MCRACGIAGSLAILGFCLAGCAAQSGPDSGTSLKTLRLSDAVDLRRAMRADEETDLAYKLQFGRDQLPIYFGELNTYDDDDQPLTSVPIIAQKQGQKWRAIRLDDSHLKNAAWVVVAAGPVRGEIWGVLDQPIDMSRSGGGDDLQTDLLLVHSTDAGQTFSLVALRKPYPAAEFDSLCIGGNGRGRISVYLASGDSSDKTRPGYYSFTTSDKGQSWTRGRFEADSLVPAGRVSDDEQPDIHSPVQTASYRRK